MEAQEIVVKHLSESTTAESPLKIEVESNSKGFKYTVSFKGDLTLQTIEDVADVVDRAYKAIKERMEGKRVEGEEQ